METTIIIGQLASLVVILAIACGTLIFYKHPKGDISGHDGNRSAKTFSPRDKKG